MSCSCTGIDKNDFIKNQTKTVLRRNIYKFTLIRHFKQFESNTLLEITLNYVFLTIDNYHFELTVLAITTLIFNVSVTFGDTENFRFRYFRVYKVRVIMFCLRKMTT